MKGKLDDESGPYEMGAAAGSVDEDGAPLVCRICFEESEQADLISPCRCKGARGMASTRGNDGSMSRATQPIPSRAASWDPAVHCWCHQIG